MSKSVGDIMKKINKSAIAAVVLQVLSTGALASSYDEDRQSSSNGRMAMNGGAIEQSAKTKPSASSSQKKQKLEKADIEKIRETSVNSSSNNFADKSELTKDLMNQAKFWHDKMQHSKAMQTLNRILLSDTHNEEVLFLMATWSYEVNDTANGKKYRDRLAKFSPNSPYLQQLDNQRGMSSLSSEQLNHARVFASNGNVSRALTEYNKLFSGNTPPKALVSEYYLTMSGDPNYYDRAVNGIISYIKKNPDDISAQVTYAKILTYRKSTIRKGIKILDYYASKSLQADEALGVALRWLEPTEEDEVYYTNYLDRHPGENEVKKYYNSVIIGNISKKAYDKTNTDKEDAKRDFEKILSKNPNNQDALEALGYLHLDLKQYVKAIDYLEKAAALGGSKAPKLKHDAALANARLSLSVGNYDKALDAVELLLSENAYDKDALLMKADIAKKKKDYSKAELALVTAQSIDPRDNGINEMLFYLYREEGKNDQATALLKSMNPTLREKIEKAISGKAFVDPIPPIRQKAADFVKSGNIPSAIETLNTGILKQKNATWLRYDLALLLKKQGFEAGAYSQIAELKKQGASDEDLFAAASALNELKEYNSSLECLSRIKHTSDKVRRLKAQIDINRNFSVVESYLKDGNKTAAYNTLESARFIPSALTQAQLSHLALLYLNCGQKDKALELANLAYARDLDLNAGVSEYADLISVFNATGNYDKARALSTNQSIIENSTTEELTKMNNADAIRQADSLRELNRCADAYDILYPLLEKDPNNEELKMAMARLYQQNGMYDEAYTIYDDILFENPDSQNALEGAVNAALGNNDFEKATVIASRINSSDDPRVLTLLARVDKNNKNYNGAIAKLNKARSLLDSRYSFPSVQNANTSLNMKTGANTHQRSNPFKNRNSNLANVFGSNKTKKKNLPWVNSKSSSYTVNNMTTDDVKDAINEINFMLRDLEEKRATSVKIAFEASQKDGEAGLSKLNYFASPVTMSTPVLNNSKLSVRVTPTTSYAGNVSGDNGHKFGTNALNVGVQNLVTRVNSLKEGYNRLTTDDDRNSFKRANGLDGLDPNDVTLLLSPDLLDGADFPLTTALGRQKLIQYLSSFTDVQKVMKAVNSVQSASNKMYDFKAKRSSGAAFDIALSDDNYKLDFGVTPVGKDGTTLEGGAFYNLRLSKNSALNFNLERRAVRDSVLSYYGYEDKMSGTFWGGVTKNGGSIEYTYDDGFMGGNVKGSYYSYNGKNVLSNNMYGITTGLYVHPLRPTMYQDMTIGVKLDYEHFKNSQNNFTLGYGGYFSPNKYLLASIPVHFVKRTENMVFNADLELGYQTYTEKEMPYFPLHNQYQQDLEYLAKLGFVENYSHARKEESGIGGSIKLSLDYYLLDDLVVGGSFSYNTFGEYKEMCEMLYIKSIIGDL